MRFINLPQKFYKKIFVESTNRKYVRMVGNYTKKILELTYYAIISRPQIAQFKHFHKKIESPVYRKRIFEVNRWKKLQRKKIYTV